MHLLGREHPILCVTERDIMAGKVFMNIFTNITQKSPFRWKNL